jgi:GT2 family glycosyltransferase
VRTTVVIPLPSDPATALSVLEALAAQPDEPEHDVVLVDDACPAIAPLLAQVEGDVAIVRLAERVGLSGAVRAGLERADGEAVAVLLPGVAPARGWLGPLIAALTDGAPAAVTPVSGSAPTDPVAALGLAARRDTLQAVGPAPDVPDELVIAALTSRLARHGDVRSVGTAVVGPAPGRLGPAYGTSPELSVVVPTLDAGSARVRRCLAAITATVDVAHEALLMHNGAAPQGFTAPVNAGLRAARGAYVVVMNDDVEPQPGWWPPLRAALDAGSAVAFPRTLEGFDREDFAAWCFAMTREGVERHSVAPGEFFDPELVVHFQDSDLLVRLLACGTPPVRVPEATIRHGLSETLSSEDPALQSWLSEQVARDQAAFARKHPAVWARHHMVATR